jgi:hypothetical protein
VKKQESKMGEETPVTKAPAIILTITPGRSGTHYLASLFSVVSNVHAVHEPEPTLSSREFAQGELSAEETAKLYNEKVDSILVSCKNACPSTYVETSHTLLSHTPAPSPLIEGLLEKLEGHSVGIVILERNPAQVMLSRSHLGHMTRYTESGEGRYRGVGWIYTPGSASAQLSPIKPDSQLTQLELLAGYVLNVAAVARNFEKEYKEHPRLMIYRIDLDDLSGNMEAAANMMDFFNLNYNKEALVRVMNGGKTNERKEDKEFARNRDKARIAREDCEAALAEYEYLLGKTSPL